jgi:hypothetical protein
MDDDYLQLMKLKLVTQVTGALHEAQKLQLQYWPLIVLPHVKKTTFKFSFDNKELIFLIEDTHGRKPKDLRKRLKILVKMTKDLLGEEYTVKVLNKTNAKAKRTSGKKRSNKR